MLWEIWHYSLELIMKRSEEIAIILQTIAEMANVINHLDKQRVELELQVKNLRVMRETLIKMLPRLDRVDDIFREENHQP